MTKQTMHGSTHLQQTAESAKHIKRLRINGERWSIVYLKYVIFIFLWRLQTHWPMLAARSVCWLVCSVHWILVCLFVSLMGTTCRNVLVKSCIKILWQKQYIFHDTFEFLCWTTWRHLYFTKLQCIHFFLFLQHGKDAKEMPVLL